MIIIICHYILSLQGIGDSAQGFVNGVLFCLLTSVVRKKMISCCGRHCKIICCRSKKFQLPVDIESETEQPSSEITHDNGSPPRTLHTRLVDFNIGADSSQYGSQK